MLTSDSLQTDFLVKLNGKSVNVVILRNCIISHIGMEILAKKEACGILQLIRDLHFIGKLRKRASNKYKREREQKILNEDNRNTNLLFPFMGDKVSQRNVRNASSNIGGAH